MRMVKLQNTGSQISLVGVIGYNSCGKAVSQYFCAETESFQVQMTMETGWTRSATCPTSNQGHLLRWWLGRCNCQSSHAWPWNSIFCRKDKAYTAFAYARKGLTTSRAIERYLPVHQATKCVLHLSMRMENIFIHSPHGIILHDPDRKKAIMYRISQRREQDCYISTQAIGASTQGDSAHQFENPGSSESCQSLPPGLDRPQESPASMVWPLQSCILQRATDLGLAEPPTWLPRILEPGHDKQP